MRLFGQCKCHAALLLMPVVAGAVFQWCAPSASSSTPVGLAWPGVILSLLNDRPVWRNQGNCSTYLHTGGKASEAPFIIPLHAALRMYKQVQPPVVLRGHPPGCPGRLRP